MKLRRILAVLVAIAMLAGFAITASATAGTRVNLGSNTAAVFNNGTITVSFVIPTGALPDGKSLGLGDTYTMSKNLSDAVDGPNWGGTPGYSPGDAGWDAPDGTLCETDDCDDDDYCNGYAITGAINFTQLFSGRMTFNLAVNSRYFGGNVEHWPNSDAFNDAIYMITFTSGDLSGQSIRSSSVTFAPIRTNATWTFGNATHGVAWGQMNVANRAAAMANGVNFVVTINEAHAMPTFMQYSIDGGNNWNNLMFAGTTASVHLDAWNADFGMWAFDQILIRNQTLNGRTITAAYLEAVGGGAAAPEGDEGEEEDFLCEECEDEDCDGFDCLDDEDFCDDDCEDDCCNDGGSDLNQGGGNQGGNVTIDLCATCGEADCDDCGDADDVNVPTGVALALFPALVAGAAVAFARKRK